MYSLPVPYKGQFKAIIPRDKFMLKSQLHFTFRNNDCIKTFPKTYYCTKQEIEEINSDTPCELLALDMKNTSQCKQISLTLTKSKFNQLGSTNNWLGIFPNEDTLKVTCKQQQEVKKLKGTFLIEIPVGCQIKSTAQMLANEKSIADSQPILLPDIQITNDTLPTLKPGVPLEDIKLDQLSDNLYQLTENFPLQWTTGISHTPSAWTIVIYIAVAGTIAAYILKKFNPRKKTASQAPVVTSPSIQLPLPS